jgi:hypothetical protein
VTVPATPDSSDADLSEDTLIHDTISQGESYG